MEKSKEYYEFRKMIKFLGGQRGQGTELISVYIQPGANVNDVSARLRDEYGQAMNIKSKQTRKNVQSAIEKITQMLKGVHRPPEHGVAIFCGSVGGKIELYTVVPPEPITMQLYRCDSSFVVDPLQEMIEPKEIYGLLTMDRREATIALLKGKRIDIINHLTSGVPGKHKSGGQSALRFDRVIEIMAHDFNKRIGEHATKVFRSPKVRGVLVGGPGPTKHAFLKGEFFQKAVKDKVVGTLDTSYTDDFGIKEMVDKAGEIIKELEVNHEKDLINRFIKDATGGGLATYGEREVREALKAGKVDTLLLSEGLEWHRVKLSCQSCGNEETKTVKDIAKFKKEIRKCSCGGKQEIVETQELVEDLSVLAESAGSHVEMISTETAEGEQFHSGFGGIGALLRYK